MKNNALMEFLLRNFSDAKPASAGREITMRCRFCGDSQKDASARHMYVFLGDDEKPPMYHCFKCNESGILTKNIIKKWAPNISDIEIDSANISSVKPGKKLYRRNSNIIYNIHIPINNFPSNREIESLLYIQKRLGLRMDYMEAIQNKIILDPYQFFRYNGRMIERELYIPDVDSYVGFLSIDNSSVILRNIRNGEIRYRHFRLVNDSSSKTYYCIPTVVNRLKIFGNDRIHIRIAEGVFDILGVCYNVMNNNRSQNIYITSNGKDHTNTILYSILSLSIFSPIIDLYLDNDTNSDTYRPIAKRLYRMGIPLIFHKNQYMGEKDYGVSREKIIDKSFK